MCVSLRLENTQKLIETYNSWTVARATALDGCALEGAVKQKLSTLLRADVGSADWDLLHLSRCPPLLNGSNRQHDLQDTVVQHEQADDGNISGDWIFL